MATNYGMQELIKTINRLQDVFTTTGQNLGFSLPQIAVVGGQSAGKSSVLEGFVGRDFLPRGSGIVTRRPLVLQLNHSDEGEWAEFLHTGTKKFLDFDQVRKEIEDETDRETGINKGISKKPINLRVYSPNVVDLTLIDLPGLTKVPVGDQPDDIEYQIREMIEDYIFQENTIILAVSPANQDLANSDALKLARKADPDGLRTLGVITKLDLMDEGTNAIDIFEGKILPLKKGYIGIVNRSQKDIDDNKTIDQAFEKEKEYFRNSPYKNMGDHMGTRFLQQTLNEQLGKHIQEKLPGLRTGLQSKIQEINDKLKTMGYYDESEKNKIKLLYKLINQFVEALRTSLEGNTINVSGSTLKTGANINYTIYNDVYSLIQSSASLEPSLEEITLIIANLSGFRNHIFISQLAFDKAVIPLVEKYKIPLGSGVSLIKDLLIGCVEECSKTHLDSYPRLREEILYFVNNNIGKNADSTNSHLMAHIDAQKAFMNVKHPDYTQLRHKLEPSLPIGNMRPTSSDSDKSHDFDSKGTEDSSDMDPEEAIHMGNVTLLTTGFRSDKEMFAVIYPSKLEFYKDELQFTTDGTKSGLKNMLGRSSREEANFYVSSSTGQTPTKGKPTQSISLNGCRCDSRESPKGRHYIIYRGDGKHLYKNEKRLEMLATPDLEEGWTNAFKEIGVFQEVKGSIHSQEPQKRGWNVFSRSKSTATNHTEDVKSDSVIQGQASLIREMVRRYMKIVHTTVLDIIPKYIVMALVQPTLTYAKESLVGDLLDGRKTDAEKEELMESGSDEKRQIDQLVANVKATQQALDIVTDMSGHGRK